MKINCFGKSPFMGVAKAASEVMNFGVEVLSFSFNQLDKKSYVKSFKNVIEQEPQAVIFTPFFLEETKLIVVKLEEKSIPYFFLNIDAEGFNNSSFIGQDSYSAGYLAGKLMHLSTGHNATFLVPLLKSKIYNNVVIEKRINGFENFFEEQNISYSTKQVNFDNLEDLNEIQDKLKTLLDEDASIKGIWVPTSRISTITKCIAPKRLKKLKLIGFDTTIHNVEALRNDKITFLISQKSFNQGFRAVKEIADFFIQNKIPKQNILSPLEIITKENLEFSQRNKWEYKKNNEF